jgi:DMSO reductase anchor subunit
MHPAYSVIFFTTASGAGYGLLALLAAIGLAGLEVPGRWFMSTGLGIALALIAGGLLSSTFHLGHPERAWRAFSQWRSSWLSREGVLALATFVPAGLLFLGSLAFARLDGIWLVAHAAALALATVTVIATAMIYASLKTIRQWHSIWVVPAYLALAVASGGILLFVLYHLFGTPPKLAGLGVLTAIVLALVVKLAYWAGIDRAKPTRSMVDATGLAAPVRQLAPPHTGENFVMREMGYRIGRKHTRKLRMLAVLHAFAIPSLAIAAAGFAGGGVIGLILAAVAAIACAIGVLIERWLFFAEARHVVTLYYGAEGV